MTLSTTPKSTVVGIRLDPDRRGWVEAEAARRGMTVRALFEEYIDRNRAGDIPPPAGEAPATDPGAREGATDAETIRPTPVSPGVRTCADLPHLTSLPGCAVRTAISLTSSVMKAGGRTARSGWDTLASATRCGRSS